MSAATLAVLQGLLRAVQAATESDLTPPARASGYLATTAEVEKLLAGWTAERRERVVQLRLRQTGERARRLQDTGSPTTANLQRIGNVADHYPWPALPADASDGKNQPFANLSHRLSLAGTGPALDAVLQAARGDAGAGAVERRSWTASRTAAFLHQVRQVDDVLRRLQIAKDVGAVTGARLSTVLALYRAEGALIVPPSVSTVTGQDTTDAGEAVPLPTAQEDIRVKMNIPVVFGQGAWVAGREAWSRNVDDGGEDALVTWANGDYHIVLAGLDQFVNPDVRFRTPSGVQLDDEQWREWLQPAGPDRGRAAAREYEAGRAQLRVLPEWGVRPGQPPVAYVVVPVDSVAFGAAVLLPALRLFARCRQTNVIFQASVDMTQSDDYGYVVYHLGQNGARKLLMSAVGWADHKRGSLAGPVVAALDAGDPAARASAARVRRARQLSDRDTAKHWATLEPFIFGHLDVVLAFVMAAGRADWPTYLDDGTTSVRGNLHRFVQVRRFYAAWLGE